MGEGAAFAVLARPKRALAVLVLGSQHGRKGALLQSPSESFDASDEPWDIHQSLQSREPFGNLLQDLEVLRGDTHGGAMGSRGWDPVDGILWMGSCGSDLAGGILRMESCEWYPVAGILPGWLIRMVHPSSG